MLNAGELLSSPVVANKTMNRGRVLSGINSYDRELRFDIMQFLTERIHLRGTATWYDACCGQGLALVEAGQQFKAMPWGHPVWIVGVDLVGMFTGVSASGVSLICADVTTFVPDRPVDLITCVHGLHYLGDKLGFVQNAYDMLMPGGVFLGHLDSSNVKRDGQNQSAWPWAVRHAAKKGTSLALKNHLLHIERTEAPLDFGVIYQGASVSAYPNYTGITVIDSWYGVN